MIAETTAIKSKLKLSDLEKELKEAKQQLMSSYREGDKEMSYDIESRIDDIKTKMEPVKAELERLNSVIQMYQEELVIYKRANNSQIVAHIEGRIKETKALITEAS